MELIVTSKGKLKEKYGEGFSKIETKVKALQAALKAEKLDSVIVYVDDAESLKPFGQKPVNTEKPDEIKCLIDKIHVKINAQKKELKHILIIGGDTIIPFHRVKNPVPFDPDKGDPDAQVLTDNPYASTDDDILIPGRSLGRMPDSKSSDISLLVSQLDTAIAYHGKKNSASKSFCYSAEVWDEASKAICAIVLGVKNYHSSPPITFMIFDLKWINSKLYQYFNLHGGEDTPNWYGQYKEGEAMPIAFSPENVDNAKVEGAIVYSEACYGTNIIDKDVNDALSLKFLVSKAICIVGSTGVAYGDAKPPAVDADLLGIKFLGNVKNYRMTFGEALMKAKQHFAKEMIGRQGNLDETDQKTLLEFALYGDPSLKLR